MKFGWLSDTHLGYRQYGLERRSLDFEKAFYDAVKHMLDMGLKLVVHTGDLLNSNRPGPEAMECLRRVHRLLISYEARMIVVSGNHDYTVPPWPNLLEPCDNMLGITVQDKQVFTYEDTRFFCLPSMSPEQFRAVEWPPANFMLCHMQIQEFIGFASMGAIAVKDLPLDHYDAILVGDIHITQINKYPREGKTFPALVGYAGSTELCSESEPDHKSWMLVEFERGKPIQMMPHGIYTRPVIRVKVTETDSVESHIAECIRRHESQVANTGDTRNPIVFIEYPSHIPGVMERFQAALNPDSWILRFKPVLQQQALTGVPLPPTGQELTPKDLLRAHLAIRSDLLPLAEQLINPELNANATLDAYIDGRLRQIEAATGAVDGGASAAP